MKNCEEYEALLDLYTDGELDAEDMERVRRHLAECPACQAYVDDVMAMCAAFPEVEETEVPDGFAEGVLAAIGTAPAKKKPVWTKVLVPLAACCAILVLMQNSPVRQNDRIESAAAASMAFAPAAAEDAAEAAEEPAAPAAPMLAAVTDSADAQTAVKNGVNGRAEAAWAKDGDTVFAAEAFLKPEDVGDALKDFEGQPYCSPDRPEEIIGVSYAMDRETFRRILHDELENPADPAENPEHTTDLCRIVVLDAVAMEG